MAHETPGCQHPICHAGIPGALTSTTSFCSTFVLLLVSAPSTLAPALCLNSTHFSSPSSNPYEAFLGFSELLLYYYGANILLKLRLDQGF